MIHSKGATKINKHIDEIKWVSMYIKKYWKAIFVYTLIGVFGTVLSLIGSIMSKTLIDIVTGHETGKIMQVAVFMVFFGCTSIIFNGISKRVSVYYSVVVQNEIQSDVYNRVMESDWESLNEFRSGDLLNRINGDVSAISGSVIGWIPSLLIRGVQFVGSLAIIVYYDFTMAIIALVSVPVSAVASRLLLKKMREYNDKLREASSEMMSFQEDSFQNIQSIKAFNVVNLFENQMLDVQQNYKDISLKFNTLAVATTSFMSFVAMLVSYACLGWGVYRLWSGAIAFGTLTLFLQLASNLNGSFSALMTLVPQAVAALTSAGRIMAIVSLSKEEDTGDDCSKLLKNKGELQVIFDKVSFNYKNKENVLNNISFKAKSGEVIGIIGPTGEGKTTLIRILLGLIKPNSGEASVSKGKENIRLSVSTRELFSYVPQENTLFAGTVRENLTLGTEDKTDDEIISALKLSCAWEFVNNLPKGLMSEVKERGKGFSQGQAQRLAIARAILKDSPIMLLDEATSALDVDTEHRIIENIFNNKSDRIYFVVSHRPSVFKVCDKIYKIENTFLIETIGEIN